MCNSGCCLLVDGQVAWISAAVAVDTAMDVPPENNVLAPAKLPGCRQGRLRQAFHRCGAIPLIHISMGCRQDQMLLTEMLTEMLNGSRQLLCMVAVAGCHAWDAVHAGPAVLSCGA